MSGSPDERGAGGVDRAPEGGPARPTFTSRLAMLVTMVGVAIGLGNIWRFPYMVGEFGGAAFVLFYLAAVLFVGAPALMAEWALGRHTRRGPVGAFQRVGLPGGRLVGWIFFAGVTAATAYYANALGWVFAHALGYVTGALGAGWDPGGVLPPETGFDAASFRLQLVFTGAVILACAYILSRGLRRGIELAGKIIVPTLLAVLVLLIGRALTLDGAAAGIDWYILKFRPEDLTGTVMVAALGQAIFSLSLGGTFMVVYGSYLHENDDLPTNAAWTALGDTTAGLLAGLAIFPAVFALGLAPDSGPGLLFSTLPGVFAEMPAGALFGLLFFSGLAGAALLSALGAFEVLIAGITDNTGLSRRAGVWTMAGVVYICALPTMINLEIFVPWDLTFGSGLQTVGALIAATTVGWVLPRSELMAQLRAGTSAPVPGWLYWWIRIGVPAAILAVGTYWFTTDVL